MRGASNPRSFFTASKWFPVPTLRFSTSPPESRRWPSRVTTPGAPRRYTVTWALPDSFPDSRRRRNSATLGSAGLSCSSLRNSFSASSYRCSLKAASYDFRACRASATRICSGCALFASSTGCRPSTLCTSSYLPWRYRSYAPGSRSSSDFANCCSSSFLPTDGVGTSTLFSAARQKILRFSEEGIQRPSSFAILCLLKDRLCLGIAGRLRERTLANGNSLVEALLIQAQPRGLQRRLHSGAGLNPKGRGHENEENYGGDPDLSPGQVPETRCRPPHSPGIAPLGSIPLNFRRDRG